MQAAAREVVLNLKADARSTIGTIIVSALAFGLLGISVASDAAEMTASERSAVAAGKFVMLVTNLDPSAPTVISADTCAALNASANVVAAGGLVQLGTASVASRPGQAFRTLGGVGAVRRVLDPSVRRSGVEGIASGLARSTGIPDDYIVQLRLRRSDKSSSDRLSTDLRASWFDPVRHPLGDAVAIVGLHATHVDECWVELEQHAWHLGDELLTAAMAAEEIAVGPLLDEPRSVPPRSRGWRNAATIVGVSLGALLAAQIWRSRGRWALYRSFGVRKPMTMFIAYLPAAFTSTAGAAIGWAASIVRVWEAGLDVGANGWQIALGFIYIALGISMSFAALASILVSSGDVMGRLKDRV